MAILSRTILIGYGNYQRINLTPEEQEKTMQELLEHNYKEMKRIENFAKKNNLSEREKEILLDKQLIMSYSIWTNSLEDKVHEIKSKQGKQRRTLTWQEQEKIKADIARGLEPKNIDQVLSE